MNEIFDYNKLVDTVRKSLKSVYRCTIIIDDRILMNDRYILVDTDKIDRDHIREIEDNTEFRLVSMWMADEMDEVNGKKTIRLKFKERH